MVDKIVLCLSGGGFRASIFHLGVIDYLVQTGLLGKVHSVYGVSGGAITAAHLAHRWRDYSDKKLYPDAALQLLERCHAGILDQVVWSSLVWQKNRSFEVARNLDPLFEARIPSDARPTYLVCSSISDTSQFAVEIVSRELLQLLPRHDEIRPIGKVGDNLTTSKSVAMSACFPLAFEPFTLDRNFTKIPLQVRGKDHTVADGGIVDNFGITMAHLIEHDIGEGNLFLISDAGRLFDDMDSQEIERMTMLSPMRTIDYLLNQNAASILARVESRIAAQRCRIATIKLEDARAATRNLEIDPGVVLSTMDLRTNFDSFSFSEIVSTYRLGLIIAGNVLKPLFSDQSSDVNFEGLIAGNRLRNRPLNVPWKEIQIGTGSGALGKAIETVLRKPGLAIFAAALMLFSASVAVGLVARALLRF